MKYRDEKIEKNLYKYLFARGVECSRLLNARQLPPSTLASH
jgi:hypothetical protein